ncbi:MAG: hypothetical protein J1F66_00155 [Clostridiales bacterium]|nr:hypothetical protein [Clostridiales bacterium]
MGRRILAFFLGFLIGIVFVFGALGLAIYITVTVVHPSDIYPDSDKFLGDLADMSLYDMYKSIADLYKQKVGITDENGLYFTLGQFCEHYNINPNELFGGKEVPQDVLEIPIFEFLGGDSGSAAQQVKVSAFFSFINMFSQDENGEGLFSKEMLEKLSVHNMAELYDGDKGFAYVFDLVLLSDILPGIFPRDRLDDNAIMWAFGQSSIGKLLGAFGGNILLQFKVGGAFEAMGLLKMKELLGDDSAILNAIFRSHTLSDLIDDNGSVNPDDMLNAVYLGDLLGYQRNELKESDTEGFSEKYLDEEGDRAVLSYVEGEQEKFLLVLPAIEEGEYEYYDARMTCAYTEHAHVEKCGEPDADGNYSCGLSEHTHDVNCFGFIWYSQDAALENTDEDMIKDGVHYNRASGLYTAIADSTIGELTSGNADALVDRLMDVKLHEILDGQDTSGIFGNLKDMTLRELMSDGIDQIYLGTFFGFVRKQITELDAFEVIDGIDDVMTNGDVVIRKDGDNWYLAEFDCEETEHKHSADCYQDDQLICELAEHHTASCYRFIWYEDEDCTIPSEGIKAALSSTTVGGLLDIDNTILNLTLLDVLGESNIPSMLRSLGNTKIGNLDEAIKSMYLGDFLEYVRKPIDGLEYVDEEKIVELKDSDEDDDVIYYLLILEKGTIALSTDKTHWYEGKLICTEEDSEHVHDADCYVFAWYDCKVEGEDHSHGVGDCSIVEGMMGKLANETVSNLNGLDETVMSFTLRDVMGEDVPEMLKSIQDTQIKDLNDAIEGMYLGDFLEYHRQEVELNDDYDETGIDSVMQHKTSGAFIRLDGGKWYLTQFDCTKDEHEHGESCNDGEDCAINPHTHDVACYGFVWYSCDSTTDHEHVDDCIAIGMMGKLANEKVSELDDLNDTILSFTLKDVMGDSVPDSLKAIENTPIGKLEGAIDSMYLGDFLAYSRKVVTNDKDYVDTGIDGIKENTSDGTFIRQEGDKWYLAQFDCTKDEHEHGTSCNYGENCELAQHTHNAGCYGYNWYSCGLEESEPDEEGNGGHTHDEICLVTGVMGRLASVQFVDLNDSTLRTIVNDTKLGDVIDNLGDNAMLAELADVRIGDLSNELNELYVGTAMGYHREEKADDVELIPLEGTTNVYQGVDNNNDVTYYLWDWHKNKYFNAQLNCKDTTHHIHNESCYGDGELICGKQAHDDSCFGFIWYDNNGSVVKGLDSKMSNLTLDGLASGELDGILAGLTIGDLMDSGMIKDMSEEDEYKLAIIFCRTDDHKCEGEGSLLSSEKVIHECTLAGYFTYIAANNSATAKQYWEHTHANYSEDEEQTKNDHLYAWKDMPLADFITELLNAI